MDHVLKCCWKLIRFFLIPRIILLHGCSKTVLAFPSDLFQLLLDLPYSRFLELEADEVGLHLIAKVRHHSYFFMYKLIHTNLLATIITTQACYDVREGPNLWNLMYILSQSNTSDDTTEVPEFLSTHPAFEKRADIFDQRLAAVSKESVCLWRVVTSFDSQVLYRIFPYWSSHYYNVLGCRVTEVQQMSTSIYKRSSSRYQLPQTISQGG